MVGAELQFQVGILTTKANSVKTLIMVAVMAMITDLIPEMSVALSVLVMNSAVTKAPESKMSY